MCVMCPYIGANANLWYLLYNKIPSLTFSYYILMLWNQPTYILGSGNQPDVTSVKIEDFIGVQEMSTKSLIIGPLSLRLDSSAVHRIIKMIVCALEHEYEPYSKSKLGMFCEFWIFKNQVSEISL